MRCFPAKTTLAMVGLLTAIATAQTPKVQRAKQEFSTAVLASFVDWDANHNGAIEGPELDRVLQDPKVTGDAAAAAATLKGASKSKKAPKFPDWTRDYFKSNDPTLDYLAKRFITAQSRLAHASTEVMAAEELSLRECKQGTLGDCYLVAATGAAIARDPGVVSKMISLEPDLTNFVVSYPDGQKVRVPALTQGEIAMGGAGTRNGLWLRILEKAWGVRKIASSTKLDPQAEPIEAMGHGGSIHTTLEAMTGHKTQSYRLGNSKKGPNVTAEKLRSEIQDAIREHRLIGAATPSAVPVPGITHNHAYAVLGYDSATDCLKVWNPHVNKFNPKGEPGPAYGYVTVEGEFTIPLRDFMAAFSSISLETSRTQ